MYRSDRFRRVSREGSWILLGQSVAMLGSVAGVRLLTEFLAPTAYGELALAMTLANLVILIFFAPLDNAVTRFYAAAQEKDDLHDYLNTVRLVLIFMSGIIILAAVPAFAAMLIVGQVHWVMLGIPALMFGVLSGCGSVLNALHNAARKRALVALYMAIAAWSRVASAASFMIFLGPTGTVAMTGYASAALLVAGSQYMHFRKAVRATSERAGKGRDWHRQIWRFSWPLSVLGVFVWTQGASGRWALELFTTRAEVGLYAVLFQLGYFPISIATSMAMQFVAPLFYGLAGDASNRRRSGKARTLGWRLTAFTLAMTGAAFLFTQVLHPQIFRVLVAAEYASVSYLLPWMILSAGLFSSGQTIALSLMTQLNTRAMVVANVVTGLWGVLLSVAGAYRYGITGVVIAGSLFSLPHLFWMAALSHKHRVPEAI